MIGRSIERTERTERVVDRLVGSGYFAPPTSHADRFRSRQSRAYLDAARRLRDARRLRRAHRRFKIVQRVMLVVLILELAVIVLAIGNTYISTPFAAPRIEAPGAPSGSGRDAPSGSGIEAPLRKAVPPPITDLGLPI